MSKYIYLIVILIAISCNKRNKSDIAAKVGGKTILLAEVDNIVKQELYDEENRIYFIREYALDIVIKNSIIEQESEKYNVTKDSVIKKHFENTKVYYPYSNYIKEVSINGYFPNVEREYMSVSIESKKGKELLAKGYYKFINKIVMDSLLDLYDIERTLVKPIRPEIHLASIYIKFRGNRNSKVTFILVSDFECQMCRKNKKLMRDLYNKYKDRVSFGFVNYSSYKSISALAVLAAEKQNKFWEMYDIIDTSDNLLTYTEIESKVKLIDLDFDEFVTDYNSNALIDELEDTFNYLRGKGVDATPTIIINGRLVYNPTSFDEIENLIKKKLDEFKE